MKYFIITFLFSISAINSIEDFSSNATINKLKKIIDDQLLGINLSNFFEETKKQHPNFYNNIDTFINGTWFTKKSLETFLKVPGFLENMMKQTSVAQDLALISQIHSNGESLMKLFLKEPKRYNDLAEKFLEIIENKIKNEIFFKN